eukprot:TRINITY_DN11422_c0_g1_i2.p1 TRINITY_DN11422_c0_g1~~TRINITY_DN11422_c0_g1_i2.p1  ORF type:complete len:775 (-),score=174.09 TRINITY_DN11422_c0_g1_i2:15-2036(-)
MNATQWINFITQLQTYALKYSNSSIPTIYGLDSVHGAVYIYGAAYFPHNTGMAATFNTTLAELAGRITARDTSSAGIPWTFGPVLGIGIHPLWPRIYETFGEDPMVASEFGRAMIRGMQNFTGTMKTAPYATHAQPRQDGDPFLPMAACAKHYFGYSDPKSGKDRTPAWIPHRFMLRYFLPSFAAAFEEGVATVMINSGEVSGTPMHASREYLHDLLRDQIQWEGMAVTDWQDVEKLHFYHHIAATQGDAVNISVYAGIDMSMVPSDYSFPQLLLQLVQSGIVSEERIDESVTRILALKTILGLFANPLPDPKNPNIKLIGSPADRAVSLEAARESVTLLKNDGSLPLRDLHSVLVVGPAGNSLTAQNGGWSIHWGGAVSDKEFPFGTTILGGLRKLLPQNVSVTYSEGCDFSTCSNLTAVVSAARSVSAVIIAVGEAPESETAGDTNDLALSPSQQQLIEALVVLAPRVKVVVVLVEPRPRLLPASISNVSGLLMAYLPSSEGGQAIAEILLGVTNPSGRLPLTYPQFSGDVGVPYYHKFSEVDATQPLFEFGYGLSYTSFAYSALTVQPSTMRMSDTLSISVTVQNTGSVVGKESVLLFLTDLFASITPEVKMLKRFTKVSLAPGEKQLVQFSLVSSDLSFIGLQDTPVVEAGAFTLTVGSLAANFTLVKN